MSEDAVTDHVEPAASPEADAAPHRAPRGALATRRWANVLAAGGVVTAGVGTARLLGQHARLGAVDPLEAVAVVLALGVAAAAVALLASARRAPERFDAAPLAARGPFVRFGLYLVFGMYLAAAFSKPDAIVGRFLLQEMGALLGLVALLHLAPRIDAPLVRVLGRQPFSAIDVLAFNVLLGCVLLEGGLRAWLAVGTPPPWLAFERDALMYKLKPSETPGVPPNDDGYMDLAFSEQKPPGVRRVVVVGDSFCAGHVTYADNWLTLADDALGEPVEVYNLGIHRNGPCEYLEVLRRDGLRFDPDVVVCSFYVGNDVDYGFADPHPLYKEALRSFHVIPRVLTYLKERRAAGSTVAQAVEKADEDVGAAAEMFQMSPERYVRQQRRHLELCVKGSADVDLERRWAVALGAVAEMARICEERGIPFLLVVCPDAFQTDADVLASTLAGLPERPDRYPPWPAERFDLLAPQARVLAFAKERGLTTLDLMPAFDAANAEGKGPFFLERNAHWNPAGNRVAADALAGALRPLVQPR